MSIIGWKLGFVDTLSRSEDALYGLAKRLRVDRGVPMEARGHTLLVAQHRLRLDQTEPQHGLDIVEVLRVVTLGLGERLRVEIEMMERKPLARALGRPLEPDESSNESIVAAMGSVRILRRKALVEAELGPIVDGWDVESQTDEPRPAYRDQQRLDRLRAPMQVVESPGHEIRTGEPGADR